MLRRLCVGMTLFAGLSLAVPLCSAQSALLNLPRPSQHAAVTQRVGITDITISYHRPLVNKREIWGKVVPYGQVWRAGANENTTIKFTDDVAIEGKTVAKGIYGLHMIPGENEWTVILSKTSTAWGSFTYKEDNDAVRVTVKPRPSAFHEALTYDFDDVTADSTVATLSWEKITVPINISVNVHEIVKASLPNQLQGLAQYTWEGWDDAANYLLAEKYDLDDALKYEDTSVRTEERYDNLMTKSQILKAMGRDQDATTAKNRAIEVATSFQLYGYGRQLQRDGKEKEAFDIYRQAVKKNPNDWVALLGSARIHSAQGDYDSALKEVKLSQSGAPENQKIFLVQMIKKLEAKQDINKN